MLRTESIKMWRYKTEVRTWSIREDMIRTRLNLGCTLKLFFNKNHECNWSPGQSTCNPNVNTAVCVNSSSQNTVNADAT